MSWFQKFSARTKLLLAFFFVCSILGSISAFALVKMGAINATIQVVFNEQLRPVAALGKTLIVVANVGGVGEAADSEATDEERRSELAAIEVARKEFAATYDGVVVPVATVAAEKALTIKIKENFEEFCELGVQMTNLAMQNETAKVLELRGKFRALGESIEAALAEEIEMNEVFAQEGLVASQSAYSSAFWLVGGLVLTGTLVGLGIGWLIASWFTKALLEVSAIADNVASASQQLAAAAEELSSGAQEQASSLEETASSLEEITGTVQQNSDNAQQANQLAGNSRRVAENGGDVVSKAVQGMNEINVASKRIADIITAIDEIAFQTNLLALNAAVEAARAGEQGRGFAVVAGEVRNLAQRSAGAAKEIKSLIQDSVGKVEVGSELVNKSGHTLSEIVSSVKRVTDIVSEIAAASREQASGIEQVNRAVTQMDQVVQTNAAQTEELTATAEGLSSQASQLQSLVAQFNLTKRESLSTSSFTSNRKASPRFTSSRAAMPTPTRKPVSKPARFEDSIESQVERELDLISAGAGGDGFEKF